MIIDFHTHIFPDKIAEKTISALSKSASIPPHLNGMVTDLIESAGSAKINICVNLPVVTRPSQIESVNSFSRCLNEEIGAQGGLISFAGIHPDNEDVVGELEKIKKNGFLGIKLHPDYQGVFFDDERYIRILRCAKELDLITVTHAGLDGAFIGQEIKCTPTRVLRALDRIGGYERLVLAHLGGNELYEDVYREIAGENIYFDTAYVLKNMDTSLIERLILRHGADKILFATDSPWQGQNEMVRIINSLGIDAENKEKILYKNAIKLLNIGEIC